jgi:hypothetical protein
MFKDKVLGSTDLLLNMCRSAGLVVAVSFFALAGCAQVSSVSPGTPVADVFKQYGRPAVSCPSRDGGKRMVWTQQPEGETAYSIDITPQGVVSAPAQQVLTDSSFSVLGNGEVWSRERVHCQFGPPANITRDNWGDDQQWVWGYRYLRQGSDAQMMYVYLGNDGVQVTKFRSLPDPDRNSELAGGWPL